MHILAVDDDPKIRDLLQQFLEAEGHTIDMATTGEEALAAIKKREPRLVMLDIRLPGQSGLDVLREIKKTKPAITIVMMTGFKEAELVVTAFREGAVDCILKPFNFDYIKLNVLSRIPE